MADNLLSASGLSKAYGSQVLLDRVSFGIEVGARVGLIGPNGAGKTTLLRIVAGLEAPDEGTCARRGDVRMGYLEQSPRIEGPTIRSVLEEPFGALLEAIRDYETAATAMDPRADALLARVESLGGWDWESRVRRAAEELDLGDLDRPPDRLSGGEAKRVALARLLLASPGFVVLDEPTNHLDAETVEWLESWLLRGPASALLVTHDRYFLDQVATGLVEIRGGALRPYDGGYTEYVSARAVEEALRERTHHRQLRHLMAELEWARRSPKARTTKSQARLQRIEETRDEVARLTNGPVSLDLAFGRPPRLGGTVLELEGVAFRFPGGAPLLDGVDLLLRKGERLGVLGPNGAGKTTLLRLVTGEIEPTAGRVVRGQNTKIAVFDQHRTSLDLDRTVRDNLTPQGGDTVYPGGKPVHVASWLDRFRFSDATHRVPVRTLSGGERSRLALALFFLEEANLLLMDEPTNDLDIPTLHVLEEALVTFEGSALVISHDRYFLDKVATGLLAFDPRLEGPGRVTLHAGDYTTYHERRAARLQARDADEKRARDAAAASAVASASPAAPPKKPGLSWREARELEGLEPAVAAADAEVSRLEADFADGDLWIGGPERGLALEAQLATAREEARRLYARWEELTLRAEESES